MRVVKHWSTLPREVVASPFLEILNTQLDKVQGSLLWVALPWAGGWTR